MKSVVQQKFVRRVEGLFALADQLELRLAKARGQVVTNQSGGIQRSS